MVSSETLPMDDGRAGSVVLTFETTSVGKNKNKRDPSNLTEYCLWWSNHLDLRSGWRPLRRFHHHALTNFLEHGSA